MPELFIFFMVLIGGLIITGQVYWANKEKAWREFSEARQLNYTPNLAGKSIFNRSSHWIDSVSTVAPFKHSRYGTIRHFMSGSVESLPIEILEYEISGGESSTHYSVAILIGNIDVSPFRLMRAGMFEGIKDFFGTQDHKFGDPDFDRMVRVEAYGPKNIEKVFHQDMRRFLKGVTFESLEWQGNRLVYCRTGTLDEEFVTRAMKFLHQFWDEVPNDLKSYPGAKSLGRTEVR